MRKSCVICKNNNLTDFFDNDLCVPQSMCLFDTPKQNESSVWINHNIQKCDQCYSFQNKYLVDANILYNKSHIFPIGKIRTNMTQKIVEQIEHLSNITGIIEIGGGHGELADILQQKNPSLPYTIIDPAFMGNRNNRIIIDRFIENVDLNNFTGNLLIMSHVFEHLYEPLRVIEIIKQAKNINYILICHPDFDRYLIASSMTLNVLHIEHTFLLSNSALKNLFIQNGFHIFEDTTDNGYAIYLSFIRSNINLHEGELIRNTNILLPKKVTEYFEKIKNDIVYLNKIIDETKHPIYIWPCSFHSMYLFGYGLNYQKLNGILDNSSHKIGKYIYGYGLLCSSFHEKTITTSPITIILCGGCFTKELQIPQNDNIQYIVAY